MRLSIDVHLPVSLIEQNFKNNYLKLENSKNYLELQIANFRNIMLLIVSVFIFCNPLCMWRLFAHENELHIFVRNTEPIIYRSNKRRD